MIAPAAVARPAVLPDWLALWQEDAIDPDVPVIDAHHHLYDRPGHTYGAAQMLDDIASGHRVMATVVVQARGYYRPDGPVALQPVGETAHMAQVAATAPPLCAAIVGHADLTLGAAVGPVLDAHVAAGQGRFRGVRHILAWDADARHLNPAYPTTADLMDTAAFRAGLAQVAARGLSFDAWLHFHQIPRLTAVARACPDLSIVLNHCGGLMGQGAYAGRRDAVRRDWRHAMADLATCPNVTVKIGGLGMALSGYGLHDRDRPPSSRDLAALWGPVVQDCIALFGPDRAMCESNFPADRVSCSYGVLWNAFKRMVASKPPAARHALLAGTAARIYRIPTEPCAPAVTACVP